METLHRISLEERSGIWLMFYETLFAFDGFYKQRVDYKQQLIRIFNDFDSAEKAAQFMISDRKITCPLIVRDDSEKNVMLRKA